MASGRHIRIELRGLACMGAVLLLGACSADLSLNNFTLVPKPEPLSKSEWAMNSANRPLTATDLLGPDGQCAGVPAQGFAQSSSASPTTAQGSPPIMGGISLQMSECEVVRRAGPVDKIDLGVDARGERVVVLTYLRGAWPGVYRFASGRLVAIERAPAPAPGPEKPQKAAPKAKKPAGT